MQKPQREHQPLHAIIRDTTATNHCRPLPKDYILGKNKKAVVIFPGNACKTTEAANGMCKIAEEMLKEKAKDCDIICFYYPELKPHMTMSEKRLSAKETGEAYFDQYLLPLIATTEESNELKRKSANQAAGNMARIMNITQCYGSYIAESLENEFAQTMPALEYLPGETDFILKQSLIIHHNNISEYMGDIPVKMSHLERITKSDKKRAQRNYNPQSFQEYIKNEQLTDEEVLFVPLSQNEYVLLANRLTKEGGDEHNGGQWEKYKTPAGITEEKIVTAMIQEFLSKTEPMNDLRDLLYKSHRHNRLNIPYDDLNDIVEYGAEFSEDYKYNKKQNKSNTLTSTLIKTNHIHD